MKCSDCKKEAVWIRATQFSGKHPFCQAHAEKEKDFKITNSSYFYWTKAKQPERWYNE